MENSALLIIMLATAFAILSPFVFVGIRESVKTQRQEIITDLALVFDASKNNKTKLIPSFEFVKYKYFVGSHKRLDILYPDTGDRRVALLANEAKRHRVDHSLKAWIIGAAAFSALSGIGVLYTLSLLVSLLSNISITPKAFHWSGITYPSPGSTEVIWLLGISAAFAGGYITALRSLYKATKNFDLSPQTIVDETLKMLVGVILVPILIVALLQTTGTVSEMFLTKPLSSTSPTALALVIATCFIAGLMPDIVLRNIIQRDKLRNFKREEVAVYKSFKITPVEIIDGIDSDIRNRLDDHHIHSTQNLATANPLMLFVETPFGVYQIMDWVAQAQLCSSVGRDKIVQLWPLGVRTLFDLERLASTSGPRNQMLLLEVGRILLGNLIIPLKIPPEDYAEAVSLVKTSIELRLDDPHVQRLRQIYIAVGNRLGERSRRFRRNTCGYRITYRSRCRRDDGTRSAADRCAFAYPRTPAK